LYDDIMNGEVFSLEMSNTPNLTRGIGIKSNPYSMSN
jgi:putative alpha-1,2-mannosidase